MDVFVDEPLKKKTVQVYLRLRPVNEFELSRRSSNCVSIENGGCSAIKINSPVEGECDFTFEQVFREASTQEEVYQKAVAHLSSFALEGFNSALITYGQTGSGKTHTMMGCCDCVRTNPHGSPKKVHANGMGMIRHAIKDVFRIAKGSPPAVEYIVRCSFVEIYMEKILDLLNPANRSVQIVSSGPPEDGGSGRNFNFNTDGFRLRGASEACCFDESDAISLLVRGNGCRTVSSIKTNTSSRSHAAFLIKVEQKDKLTGISRMGQLLMIDMAGSELSAKGGISSSTANVPIHQEATMVNESLSLLNTTVKMIVNNRNKRGGYHDTPYEKSKLTHLLKDSFGGNCQTSIILTASPSSDNITESIRTMKFGHNCQSVTNFVRANVDISPNDFRKLLNDSQKTQQDLLHLVDKLSAECFQLKQDAVNQEFVESHYSGALWKTIEKVLSDGTTSLSYEFTSGVGTDNGGKELLLKNELCLSGKGRKNVECLLAQRLSEVAVLRTQIDKYASEQKRNERELMSVKNELQVVAQRKQEVEHNLRTSQFREYEATVFLRQFRRFYRRLLRNKALQGTGGTSEVIGRVPGVPDLNDLIDIDSLLLEAGLIEESELHDDAATGAYRPSAQALSRSTEASNKAWRQAACQGKVDVVESFDQELSVGRRRVLVDHGGVQDEIGASAKHLGPLMTNRQQFLSTPSGRLAISREKELERDLLRATEKCIELQMALNEEKATVDILTNRTSNANKKKIAQESHHLKQQLEKKTHDLQAIIWKMNELHLINKTYNEKMSNREQHVTYLEENLDELQGSIRNMIFERNEAEKNLGSELYNLKILMDAMTVPLWQFGEGGIIGQPLCSRVYLPVCSDVLKVKEDMHVEDLKRLESFEETASDDDRSEYEPGTCHQDASTQTCTSSEIELTAPRAHALPCLFFVHHSPVAATEKQDTETATKQNFLPRNDNVVSNGVWRPAGSLPRRFVHKFGFMLRPGVLKESPSKSRSDR